ncbi:MAG: hypothetical protein ACLSH6_03285 [Limosilactobacillus pontis]
MAKTLHKAPQMIASDLVEKVDTRASIRWS